MEASVRPSVRSEKPMPDFDEHVGPLETSTFVRRVRLDGAKNSI